MTPLELKQIWFAQTLARFLFDARARGYSATFGEAWRPPEMAAIYAKEGKGIINSIHTLRLAVDLNWWYQGNLVETPQVLAELWQSYSSELYTCTAGFFFKPSPDSDHFSVENDGVK